MTESLENEPPKASPAAPLSYAAPTATDRSYPIALIAMRMLALILAYNALLSGLDLVFGLLTSGAPWIALRMTAIFFAMYGLASGLLWIMSPRLARWMLREAPQSGSGAEVGPWAQPIELLAVGIATLGVWLLAIEALPQLAGFAANIVMRMHSPAVSGMEPIWQSEQNAMITCAAKVVIGVFLLFRCKWIAVRWSGLKPARALTGDGPL